MQTKTAILRGLDVIDALCRFVNKKLINMFHDLENINAFVVFYLIKIEWHVPAEDHSNKMQ
jgi:hypothetical protein